MIKTFRHLGKYTKEDFCFKILESREHFNKILYTDDVNKQVEIFTSNFIKCLDDCAPYATKEIKRPFAPWMTDNLQEIVKLKNKTRQKLRFDRLNPDLQDQYKREKKQIKTLIDESKNRYYSNKLNENKGNIAKTWKAIREIIPNSKHNASNCNFDNEIAKANDFNKHSLSLSLSLSLSHLSHFRTGK